METITIEITKQEGDLVMPNYPHQLYASISKSDGKYDLEIPDVDKFRKFLNDEIEKLAHLKKADSWKQVSIDYNNLESILQKLAFVCVELNSSPMIGFDDKEVK